MVKRLQIARKAETYVSSGVESITMPKAPISKIIISGTVSSDCTGNVTANACIEWIKIRINGKVFVDLSGEQIAGAVPWAIQVLREFYLQKHHVAMPAEQWIIEFPDALPKDAQIDLLWKWASYTDAGCSSDDLTYYADVLYEMEDKVKGKVIVPYFQADRFSTGALTGHRIHMIPALPFKLRAVVFGTESSNALSATAMATLKVSDPNRVYFDGSMIELEGQQEARARKALTTGMYVIVFIGGIKVSPNSLRFDFYKSTGGTDVKAHMIYICY